MKKSIFCLLALFIGFSVQAQKPVQLGSYQFTIETQVPHTPIKNQQKTGTCWSFSSCSFLESELIRTGVGDTDLSEMYVVRQTYPKKAETYLKNKGNVPFSAGGLGHDVLNCIRENGLMPEDAFLTTMKKEGVLDESDAHQALESSLKEWSAAPAPPKDWQEQFKLKAERNVGATPNQFTVAGNQYTPQSYAKTLKLNADDYVGFTSFLHHPNYEAFAIEVPDNFSQGKYWNLPMVEFTELAKIAIRQGYSLFWDGDVSNIGFSGEKGLAIVPAEENTKELFSRIYSEKEISEDQRQTAFESKDLTDDHLMHIVGLAQDTQGKTYFVVKNSWGETGAAKGYLYMSENYFNMFTVSYITHKAIVPADIKEKLGW